MSAQIIAALRRRADAIEQKSSDLRDARLGDHARILMEIATEFRALADDAEGREPQTGVDWE